MSEMAVGNGDGGGSHDGVDKTIFSVGHGNMVDPNVGGTKDGDTIAVAHGPEADVIRGVSNRATWAGNNVVDLNAVDDDVLDELEGDPSSVGNVDVGAPAIDGLVGGDQELGV